MGDPKPPQKTSSNKGSFGPERTNADLLARLAFLDEFIADEPDVIARLKAIQERINIKERLGK